MIYIYPQTITDVQNFIRQNWKNKKVQFHSNPAAWHKYRYIQVSTALDDETIHYELTNGHIELHLEGEDYDLYRYLRNNIPSEYGELQWHRWYNMTQGRLRIEVELNTIEEVFTGFKQIIELVDPLLIKYQKCNYPQPVSQPSADNSVLLEKLSLKEVLNKNLSIPEYQRIYCWPEKNVLLLLEDIMEVRNHQYHVGTLILQNKQYNHDIIDGQQRLVTFALILNQLDPQILNQFEHPSLLKQKFRSSEANKYIAYNKFLIHNFFDRYNFNSDKKTNLAERILNYICFDVLTLKDESLDLAYTFFSSQNARRGKPLTDYELLKSHHLRYISHSNEDQQRHLAKRWDNMLINSERDTGDRSVSITLGTYLYCLRKWSKNKTWYIYEENRVKNEFEAAATIPEIPAFGEQFNYYDPMQGGAHFFTYAEAFTQRYKEFQKTEQYKILWRTISCSGLLYDNESSSLISGEKRTHWWFGDIIATFLFAYYLKFNNLYLAEALTCITRIISQFRYRTGKANKQTLFDSAGKDTDLIFMINQATSPTFFLAEALGVIKRIPSLNDEQRKYIRGDYLRWEKTLYEENSQHYSTYSDFKCAHIL